MPCNCDHMESSELEKKMSEVAFCLDELDGKGAPDPLRFRDGYHDRAYNRNLNRQQCDAMTDELCSRLQEMEKDRELSELSLETQIWWRDHKKADRDRIEFDIRRAKTEQEKRAALTKLSDYERKLLGL